MKMKSTFQISLIIVAFVVACGSQPDPATGHVDSVSADTSVVSFIPDSVHYEIPSELVYEPSTYRRVNDLYFFTPAGHFYVIGFSKDGKFAYAQMMADTAPGSNNQRYEIQIRDLVKDSILWIITDSIPGTSYSDPAFTTTHIGSIDSVWKSNYEKIKTALWLHKIIPQRITERKYLEYFSGDELVVRSTRGQQESNPGGYNYWPDLKLSLVSLNSPKEILFYERHFGLRGPEWFRENGYLEDPYNKHLIVLIELYFRIGGNDVQVPMYDLAAVDPAAL